MINYLNFSNNNFLLEKVDNPTQIKHFNCIYSEGDTKDKIGLALTDKNVFYQQ